MEPQPTHSRLPLAIISLLISALVFGGVGYYIGASREAKTVDITPTPTATATIITSSTPALATNSPQTTATPTTSATTDTINYSEIKAGDKIAAMTVRAVNDKEVIFSGQTTLTGKYTYFNQGINNGIVCINLSGQESSLQLVPKNPSPDDRWLTVCLNGTDTASKNFSPSGSSGETTVVIDNYVVKRPGVDGDPSADLTKVISKK